MVQLRTRNRRKKIGVPSVKSKFDKETLLAIGEDLKAGRLPLERVRVSDDVVVGLRAVCNASGLVTLHCSYAVGDDRPFKLLGSLNDGEDNQISINDARHLTKIIKTLGDKGINVDKANDQRLLKELKRDGVAWKPK